MAHLPIVKPFEIPALGIVLHDLRAAPSEDGFAALRSGFADLQTDLLDRTRPSVRLCSAQNDVTARMSDAWNKARQASPGITWDAFSELSDPVLDDSDPDPRLGEIMFSVWHEGEAVGGWGLYNVRVRDGRAAFRISAMAIPAISGIGRHSARFVWVAIMRHILETDLECRDSKPIDLDAWRFPTRSSHAWKNADPREIMDGVISDLSDHTVEYESIDRGDVPRKISRRVVSIPIEGPGPELVA